MKTDINIHMFPARHMVRAVRLAVLSLLFWVGLMPASAQIYSTAQRGTQYKGTYEEAYGSMNDGYYGSMEAQYEYNPYQSNVYKPGSSMPNTSLRKRYTIPSYNPWSDSYAPMRTNKKNAPTGGAIGEDEESENDPEGETGAPDGFITPSDPGHQSNQSPVGEAWILLFFAAAAALVVFIRQKREKRHITIYSEVQQPSDKSNMKQHIRKSLFISIILLAGVSNAWAGDPSISGFGLQFQDDGGHWYKTGTKGANGIMDIDLGSKTNLKIVYIYANGNKNGGNICDNSYFKYEIYGETGTQNWGGIRHSSVDWGTPTFKWGSDNSSTAQIDLVKNRKPGDYRMEFLISFEGNSNSNYCGSWYDCKYSNGNWKFYWSIPDPTITISGADNLIVGTSANITAQISNYPIGATLTKVQVSGNIASSKSTTGSSDNITVSSVTPNASGKNGIKVTVTVTFGTGGTKDYTYEYDVTPPSVKNFTVTPSGNKLSGSGTQNDPYIIKYNGSLTLTLSGSQNHTDANSTIQYNTAGTWNTTNSRTISNITSTDVKNVTVKARYKNNSDANLCGAESSKTIYYRSEQVYTVTFNANGHGTAPAAQTVTQGSKATKPADLTATGYTFGGWYKEAGCTNAFDFNTAINADITLYAKWTAITYTVTLDQQSGTGGTSSVTATYGSAMPSITIPTRTGYTFGGYYTAINGGGTQYYNANGGSARVWNIADNTTLYAKWTANTYKVKFHGNGSTSGSMSDQSFTYDETAKALNANTFTRNGYNFIGWNTQENGSGTIYADKALIKNLTATNNAIINLYAQWQEKPANTVYFEPQSWWKNDDARTAIWAWSNSEAGIWIDVDYDDCTGVRFMAEIPAKYTQLQFVRLKPSSADGYNSDNNGYHNDNVWNRTEDLAVPTDSKNLYDNDNHRWTTYTAPTYTVTINPCENGTIQVAYNGQTYTSGQTISNVPIHTELNVTFTPADGYILTTPLVTYADVVADNIYSICGPATISADFVARGNTKVIYLRPNDDWLKDDAIFIAHAWKNGSSDQHDYLMTTKDDDYTGSYSCTIDKKYDHVLFARINPEDKTNQAEWWNKTKNLQITNDILEEHGYRFAIGDKVGGEGEDKDFYNGAWEENTPIWGITSDSDNWHAEKAIFMGYPGKLNILLSAASHEFKLYNFRHDHYYGNTGTYQRTNSGQWWTMDNNIGNNCTVVADIDNEAYLFQLQLITELGTYKKQISITYPDYSAGAYRLAYRDTTPNSFHPAHYIRCNTTKDQLDTVSFFIHHDKEPEILLQRCSIADVYAQNPTWETIAIYPATSSFPSGDHPNNAQLPGRKQSDATIHIGEGCGITSSGVYNFILQQTNTGEHTAELDTRATHPYEGDYYIRTDSAEGGWTNYQEASNLMTYSSYADHNEPFSYYFCKWILSDTKTANKGNVTYTVANDYSRCISDTLIGDNIIAKDGVTAGCLPDSANVRFTWDHETNALARAYIRGSGHSSDRFLVLTGKDENLKDADGKVIPEGTGTLNGILANEKLLTDMGNWIYQVDVTANRATLIKLTAKYNDFVQYFKGSEGDNDDNYASLLSSTAHDSYKIRIIYDFKTNHLITAWLPDERDTIPDNEVLGADMMIIRTNQGATQQINFTNNATLFDVGIGYAVMTFTTDHVNGSSSQYNRALYWVSFPFDVWLQDVFGFGEYGQHWIMEYYDGASRAANGLWADSDTYWKYITNPDYKLKAGEGYVLCLNLGKMTASSAVFEHTNEVSLYFPSASPLQTITSEVTAAEVPAHTCTIQRDNRNIYDSNWNLIGVPGFKDIHIDGIGGSAHEQYNDEIDADCVSFYYAYQPDDNTYTAGDASRTNNFQIMYSYMVQFAGEILWSSKTFSTTPASVAARRTGDMPSEHTLRLELAQGEDKADQTIIKLQEQDATADFDMNIDMTKIKNSGANIYTLTENTAIMVAGNALPMEKTTIPVGIEVANAGTYTLRMPDGTDGISVTLIDNQTGIHTDMLLSEYTITLDAGSHLNRFYIAVDPDRTATSVENVGEEAKGDKAKGVEKYLIDGQLFIRTAEGIFDARGQRM